MATGVLITPRADTSELPDTEASFRCIAPANDSPTPGSGFNGTQTISSKAPSLLDPSNLSPSWVVCTFGTSSGRAVMLAAMRDANRWFKDGLYFNWSSFRDALPAVNTTVPPPLWDEEERAMSLHDVSTCQKRWSFHRRRTTMEAVSAE
ncbi:hypothetical protein CPB85DRAFT_1259653 [Mucidula mucida]|nr:hypothetical protein CPB85DRAFT_1259653 [Mucidula mucida]